MAKKIIGMLSVLLVIAMVIVFFLQNERVASLNSGETSGAKATKKATGDKATKKQLKELPKVKTSDWQLLLVNASHPVTAAPEKLTNMKNEYQIDARIYDAYYELEEAALAAGHSLTVLSSYRSIAQQQEVYDTAVANHMAEGMDQRAAEAKTAEYITLPGTSEHHTGLAVDVVEQNWYAQGNGLEEEFCETLAGKWLDENVSQYGFVIRYPRDKVDITGINYEPWHLRYVGQTNATFMVKHQLALEEYLDLLGEAGK